MKTHQSIPNDFVKIRIALIREMQAITGLTCILEEPEEAVDARPHLMKDGKSTPYMSMKITNPGVKSGDDSKQNIPGTTRWNSGGCRKMLVDFNCYATTHEEAFNYMAMWQTALDLEDVQFNLRKSGIAVWVIGTVADLSKLLNTGYEGRAHLDCSFGIAMNLQSDLGSIETVTVDGHVKAELEEVDTSTTVERPQE